MMKKCFLGILFGSLLFPLFADVSRAQTGWASRGSTPSDITKNVASLANEGVTKVQDVKPNTINKDLVGAAGAPSPGTQYQISNTFIWLATSTDGVMPYLQRIIYIGMVGASILLIWNGFQLVTGKKINESKENIKYILIGVMLMSGFYAVITIATAVINYFFA